MRSLRFGVVLLLLAAAPLIPLHAAEEISRLDQLDEQIRDTEILLEQSARNNEKAQFQKQLDRLRRERGIAEQRLRLQERERDLARVRVATPQSALDDTLRRVGHSADHLKTEIERVEGELRRMEAERDTLVVQLGPLKAGDEKTLALKSELEERIFSTRDGVRALALERDALKDELQLAEETVRIKEALDRHRLPGEIQFAELLETRAAIKRARVQSEEASARLTNLQESRAVGVDDLELGRQKLAQFDDEIVFLEKQTGIFGSNVSIVRQLRTARSQKKFFDQRLTYIGLQVANIERSLLAVSRRADLSAKEGAWLASAYAAQRGRYAERLIMPAGLVLLFGLTYVVLSYVVFPRMKHRENLVLMRRFARYVLLLASAAAISGLLFDDLKVFLTTLSIVSAAIIIALQDIAASVAGWFVIMTGGKFRIGDRIEIEGDTGDVIDIDLLRTTILEVRKGLEADHPTGRVIALPNSFVLKGKVFNASHGHPHVWTRQVFTFTYESPWKEAEALVQRVLNEETSADFEEARRAAGKMEKRYGVCDAEYRPKVLVRLADFGYEFSCLHVCHFRRLDEARTRIHRRLAGELERLPHLQLAYPTQRELGGEFALVEKSSTSGPAVTAVATMPAGSAATVTVSEASTARTVSA